MDLEDRFAEYLEEIEAELKKALATAEEALVPFYGMMQYHLGWVDREFRPLPGGAGKRLRPLLCLVACQATGGDYHRALPAAAALELLHNFSQIHDDIEDGDRERRSRSTLWSVWGVPQALNAGDGMMSLAYAVLPQLWERGLPEARIRRAVEVLAETYRRLCEGQYLDISFEGRPEVEISEYLTMIERKTAALIAAPCHIGALLATDHHETIESLRLFGWNLGLAFQIVDDILGLWGDPQLTGKPVGSDLLRRKKTLPVVYALERGNEVLKGIYQKEEVSKEDVGRALQTLEALGARQYTQEMARSYCRSALEALEAIQLTQKAKEDLQALAAFLVEREY